jgi:hypothetical protein
MMSVGVVVCPGGRVTTAEGLPQSSVVKPLFTKLIVIPAPRAVDDGFLKDVRVPLSKESNTVYGWNEQPSGPQG